VNADRATLRKYFERTGCLLLVTAGGSRDNLVHFPSGVELGNLPPPFASVEDEPSGLGLGEGKQHEGEGKEKKENKGESKQGDVDNPKHDEDELALDDEDDPDENLIEVPLRDAIPEGWEVVPLPPDLDKSFVGKKVVQRWNVTGWLGDSNREAVLQPPERTCGLQLRAALSSGW